MRNTMKRLIAAALMIAMLLCGAAYAQSMRLLEVCPPYQTHGADIYSEAAGKTINKQGKTFDMAGVSYREGVRFLLMDEKIVLFNLNGRYSTMSFVLGHVDSEYLADGTVRILLDGSMAAEYTVSPYSLPETYTLNLGHAQSMIIEGMDHADVLGMADFIVTD